MPVTDELDMRLNMLLEAPELDRDKARFLVMDILGKRLRAEGWNGDKDRLPPKSIIDAGVEMFVAVHAIAKRADAETEAERRRSPL